MSLRGFYNIKMSRLLRHSAGLKGTNALCSPGCSQKLAMFFMGNFWQALGANQQANLEIVRRR